MGPGSTLKRWQSRGAVLLRRSRWIYTPLSLVFLGYLLFTEHERLWANLSGLTPPRVAQIFILIAVGHVFIALSSHFLFWSAGQTPTLRLVFCTHFNRLPARYLPGGIWQTVSRALDFSAHGLPRRAILGVVALEMALAVGLTGLIGGVLLLFDVDAAYPAVLRLVAAVGAISILMLPYLVRRQSRGSRCLRLPAYIAAVAAFAVVCLLYGSAFFLFVGQVLPEVSWAEASGVFLISWLAGFLAVFAPQGIGVFEVTAGFLLAGDLVTSVVGSMFAFRALSILSDLGVWVVFRLWLRVGGAQGCDIPAPGA